MNNNIFYSITFFIIIMIYIPLFFLFLLAILTNIPNSSWQGCNIPNSSIFYHYNDIYTYIFLIVINDINKCCRKFQLWRDGVSAMALLYGSKLCRWCVLKRSILRRNKSLNRLSNKLQRWPLKFKIRSTGVALWANVFSITFCLLEPQRKPEPLRNKRTLTSNYNLVICFLILCTIYALKEI